MRGSQLKTLAVATVAAVALTGCGGDQAGAGDGAGENPEVLDRSEQPVTGGEQAGQQAPANLPEGVTQEQFAQGQQLFTGQGGCQACHGPQATGTQLAPDLTDGQWLNLDSPTMDDVTQLIQNGVPQPIEHPAPMPPMGGANLSQDQVQALAAYVMGISQG